jgi:hypothetical protein
MKSLANHCRERLSIESANESDGLREGFRANEKSRQVAAGESFYFGGADGARTRDLRRDRPAF